MKAETAKKLSSNELAFRPLTPDLLEPLGEVLRSSWGATCWCMHPRMTDAQMRDLPGEGPLKLRRRMALEKLARRSVAPGLLAFEGEQAVGWVAVAPRTELVRVDRSRATPPFDEQAAWVISCITVRKSERGRGIGTELIRAAANYAFTNGAPLIEAYPRAGEQRVGDDSAYFGTEPLFRRAGFEVVRAPLANLPSNWTPRVVVRLTAP